jgi:PAS domain S-box-containing protein
VNGSPDDPVGILLVDDHPPNLLALEAILASAGCRLVSVTSGAEAVARAASEDFAVVLLDVRMPDMDGFEVARRLRTQPRTRALPIIFVTAHEADVAQVHRAYAVGAVDYLTKPLVPEVVRGKVATFVALSAQAAALREAQRREHEVRLAELRVASDRRYQKFVEGIDHVIAWSADPETLRLSFISRQAERVLGHSHEELSRPDFWMRHLHPDDREPFLEAVRAARRDGVDQSCNHRMLGATGRVLWFHTGLSLQAGLDGGAPAELHGASADVTDLKQAEQEARAATRAREELLAFVSHDLKTPLQAIAMTVDRISRLGALDADAAGQAKAGIALIHRAAMQMDRLLDDLLDMERIERGRFEVDKLPEGVESVVRDAVELLEPLARERQVPLTVAVSPTAPAVVPCERGRIVQTLSNLLGNALKFTPKGGAVGVRVEPRPGAVRFAVQDTGPGIQPELLPRIFDRYTQGPDCGRQGLGLGLAIAKGIVEAHGGAIHVESQVGRGSTFVFTLPLEPTDLEAQPPAAPGSHAPALPGAAPRAGHVGPTR